MNSDGTRADGPALVSGAMRRAPPSSRVPLHFGFDACESGPYCDATRETEDERVPGSRTTAAKSRRGQGRQRMRSGASVEKMMEESVCALR